MKRTVKVSKIVKQGFGRKINSEFGYSSFDIQPTTLEVFIDPPCDLTTEEGKEDYKVLNEKLTVLTAKLLEYDVEYYASRIPELRKTLEKKQRIMDKLKQEENNAN